MALAVVIAMLASYLLSRTLVPTMARMLLAKDEGTEIDCSPEAASKRGRFGRIIHRLNCAREQGFERFRDGYGRSLQVVLRHRAFVLVVVALLGLVSILLLFIVGTDFFPTVDAGLMKLHMRAPSGTRIEETERRLMAVENRIRELIPAQELETINDMIGVPTFYNMAFVQSENIGGMDAEILIALKKGHQPTEMYQKKLREALAQDFPGTSFYFQAADIVTQVLNFGLTAPLSVQIEGLDFAKTYPYAQKMLDAMRTIPGIVDLHINQVLDYPTLQVDVDRTRAANLGMSQRDVTNTILTSLSSSVLVAPVFFLNPKNNVNYSVAVQTPIEKITSMNSIVSMPITPPSAGQLLQANTPPPPTEIVQIPSQTLADVASVYHRVSVENISHYTVQRVLNVEAHLEGRDLGSVSRDIEQKIAELGKLPAGIRITLRGQNEVMWNSFRSLGLGLILAIVLVYLLMVVLFQSWLDPFIIMTAVPGALVGIVWMLAITGTTINVESLMGSIMAVGIATSNSILLVSFANDIRIEKKGTAAEAVLESARTRLRPVLMTALAMIIGMLPMALSMGEAGEQNAPLGRAVIGGLFLATLATLFVTPVIYSLLRRELPSKYLLEKRFKAEEHGEEYKEDNKD